MLTIVFLFEGAVLLMVRLGYFSAEQVIVFYSRVLGTKSMLDVTLGVAAVFLLFGLFTAFLAWRSPRRMKYIAVKDKNGLLSIPVDTVGDFVGQALTLLDQYSSMSDFDTTVNKRGKWVYIDIRATVTDAVPIKQEINRIKETIKEQIVRVFEFPYVKIEFHVKGVDFSRGAKKTDLDEDDKLNEETPSTHVSSPAWTEEV